MATVPHFALPFRLDSTGHALTAEQDSLEEISYCVQAIMLTEIGQRPELPEFGIIDPTFQLQPLSLQEIIAAVLEQEPRASLLMEQAPDLFDQTIARVRAQVSVNQQGVSSA